MSDMTHTNEGFLRAALIGYEHQLASINEAIADIQRQLGHRPARNNVLSMRHHMSASARKRIGDAQRKRWALQRRSSKPTGRVFHCKQKGCTADPFPSLSALRSHFMRDHYYAKKRPILKRASA